MIKKIILILIAFSGLFTTQGCGGSNLDDPDIKAVRDSHTAIAARDSHSGISVVTIGNSFDKFYDSPKWSKEISQKGEVLVVFEGKISYASDRRQILIDKLDEFLIRDDYGTGNIPIHGVNKGDLYGFLYLLVWDTTNAPQINSIRKIDEEIKYKHSEICNKIQKDKENSLYILRKEKKAAFDSVPDKEVEVASLKKQISTLSGEKNDAIEPYRRKIRGLNPLPGMTKLSEERAREVERLTSEFEEIETRYNAEIAQLGNKIKDIYEKNRQIEVGIIKEYADKSDKIDKKYSYENDSRIKAVYEPFRAEKREMIRKLAMQIFHQHVPKKGDRIRITWIKSLDYNSPAKASYRLYEITGDGNQQPGISVVPWGLDWL